MKIKKMYFYFIGLVLFLGHLVSAQEEIVLPTDTIQVLKSRISKIFDGSELPGFSVIIVDDKKVLFQQSLGYADLQTRKAYTDSTVQNIASISKTFIAFSLMKAVEQEKVDLDADINIYLPFEVIHPRYPKTPITLRHLATHTSGINDDVTYDKSYMLENPEENYPLLPKKIQKYISQMRRNPKIDDSEFLENVLKVTGKWYSKKTFNKKKPGSNYQYSNIGAALAVFVIENAVDMPYEEYTKKYIMEPLQMNQTVWDISEVGDGQFATRYFNKVMAVPDYYLVTKADGGLITSTTDFGKYLIEMMKGYYGEGTLLSPESYKEMFTRKQFDKGSSGIFWGVSPGGNPNHSGSDPGVLTNTAINPDRNVGAFIMSNISTELDQKAVLSIGEIWNVLKAHNW